MKILMPVDGSEYTKRMLAYVAAHDELLGKDHEYILLTAVPLMPVYAAQYLHDDVLANYYEERADEVFKSVRAFAGQQGWKVRLVHAKGHAVDAIIDTVEADSPDLIVMGTHGHTALGNIVLGSVANGVLARCKVPVLLIR